jgi:hypothetical protein
VAAELLARARDELAPFKVPRSVSFVADLPRTPTGKLRRFVLRTGAWGTGRRLAPAGGSEDGGRADQPVARVPNRSV